MNTDTEATTPAASSSDAPASTEKARYAESDDFNWDTWWGGYIDPDNEQAGR